MRLSLLTACLVLTLALTRLGTAQMQYPLSAVVTDSGTIFVADRNLPGVWKIENNKLTRFFEGSKRYRTPLNAVRCLTLDKAGAVLAGDTSTREVYRFDKDGKPVPLTQGGIGMPMAIAVNSKGELLVADLELHRIWKVPAAGGKPEQVAEVPAPRGLWVDGDDNLWIVTHGKNQQVARLTPAGKLETVVEGRPFLFPHNIVLGPDKTAYVTDGYSKAVWKIPAGGKPEKWVSGEPLGNPVGLTWRKDKLLVVDPKANALFEIAPDGKLSKVPLESAK
jgi:sugar lactone lactonase YvrE